MDKMGDYTVGIAGLTVNQMSSDSGGLTPPSPTIHDVAQLVE